MKKILAKLNANKATLAMLGIMAFSLAVAPATYAQQDPNDPFGTGAVEEGLGGTFGTNDLRTTIASIINVALSLLGIVAVVIILIGGFQWMTAGGSEDKVGSAKKTIFSGIIGLAIILSSWAIATFVLRSLYQATTGGTPGF